MHRTEKVQVRLLNKPVGRRFDEDRIESEVIGPLPWKRSAADETPISVKNPGTARNNAHLVGQEGVRAKSYIDQGWVVDMSVLHPFLHLSAFSKRLLCACATDTKD